MFTLSTQNRMNYWAMPSRLRPPCCSSVSMIIVIKLSTPALLTTSYRYWDTNPIAHNVCMNGNPTPIISNGYFITSNNYLTRKNDCKYNLMFHLLMHEFCNFPTNWIKLMHGLFSTPMKSYNFFKKFVVNHWSFVLQKLEDYSKLYILLVTCP